MKTIKGHKYLKNCRRDAQATGLPLRLLNDLGQKVYAEAKQIAGSPHYRGASAKGMYLKWTVSSPSTLTTLMILRDRLLDLGCEVRYTEMVERRLYNPRSYVKLELS